MFAIVDVCVHGSPVPILIDIDSPVLFVCCVIISFLVCFFEFMIVGQFKFCNTSAG